MESGDYSCRCDPIRIASVRKCHPDDPHTSLQKLVDLMEHPLSADLYDRHLMILNDFIGACTTAFWVRDLPYIMRLLELLIERINTTCLFRKPLEQLLALCAVPPILNRTTEVITFSRDIQEYFSFLGFLLIKTQDKTLQDLTCRALQELLERKVPDEKCCLTLKICFNAVEESQLPDILSQILAIAEEDLYEKLLKIVLILVNISPIVCHKMMKEKMIDFLLIRLDPLWKTRNHDEMSDTLENSSSVQYFEITSKILWALLNTCKHESNAFKKDVPPPSIQALRTMRYVLQLFTIEKRSEVNRNHVMGIFLQCIDCFPNIELSATGLRRDIGILSTATEIGTGGTWASQVRFTSNEVDYMFKKMLLLALCYCSKQSDSVMTMHPKRIIPSLLKIITPNIKTAWLPQQLSKLMSLALHTLQAIVPAVPADFVYFNGPLKLLMLIDSFNAELCNVQVLQDCLKVLNSICLLGNQDILENLLINDAHTILQNTICLNLLPSKVLKLNIQRCLAYSFSILEELCRTQQACDSSAVYLCSKFLKRVLKPELEDPLFDPKLLICAVNFLWESIVWTTSNLQLFVSTGGIYTLLDLFQKSCFPVKLVTLGVLVDMCYEGSCVPHLITWRKKGMKLLPMLLELFREENIKLGVKTAANGTIADIEAPIMGKQQWYETFYANKDPNSSPATVDLLGSCRPKIYAIIQLLNHRHEIRTNIANEQYCLYDTNSLNIKDQMTLLLAENFLALKLGEAWVELNRDFEKIGIRPLAIDSEMIGLLIHRFHKWALHIKTVQEALLRKDAENEHLEENLLYNTLKETKLAESLKALQALDFIARTTERVFRLVSKMKQTSELEHSLQFTEGAEHHKTYLHKVQVNPVFNQEVSIQSNIIVDPNGKNFDLRSISSSSDSGSSTEHKEEVESGMVVSDVSATHA